jgi:hypothetical protein
MRGVIDNQAIPDDKKMIVFTGGESTRLGDDLLETIAYANSKGLATRLVTNAEWASDEQSAAKMVDDLAESGLDELNISCDDFHAEWIPLPYVVRAWKAAEHERFTSLVLAVCSGPDSIITPNTLMDAIGETIPLCFDESGDEKPLQPVKIRETRKLISNSRVLKLGRGRSLKDGYCIFPDQRGLMNTPYPERNREPVIMPSGHCCICCGVNPEGNVILDDDAPSLPELQGIRDLVLKAIGTLGPGYLMRLIKETDPQIHFRKKYSSICEICSDVTRSKRCLEILVGQRQQIQDDLRAWNLICREKDKTAMGVIQ